MDAQVGFRRRVSKPTFQRVRHTFNRKERKTAFYHVVGLAPGSPATGTFRPPLFSIGSVILFRAIKQSARGAITDRDFLRIERLPP